jgi:hypothetical protein
MKFEIRGSKCDLERAKFDLEGAKFVIATEQSNLRKIIYSKWSGSVSSTTRKPR